MPDDYGFYGKGIDGYAHYTQAFNESQKSGRKRKPSPGCGCLTAVVTVLVIAVLTVLVIIL